MRSLIILLSCFPLIGYAQPSEFVIGEEYQLYSEVLGEERSFYLKLPNSYVGDDFYVNKQYPVLVLLDGDAHIHITTGIVGSMSAGTTEKIPEMIVVAVRNTDRNRDMTPSSSSAEENASEGGSTDFLRFLEEELLPRIDHEYRTLPYWVLVGHSLAGLFTVEAFFKHSSFDAYLAIDPSLHRYEDEMAKGQSLLQKDTSFHTSFFLAQANNPFNPGKSTGTRGEALQSFVRSLESNASPRLRDAYRFYEDEDHFSVSMISMIHGLEFIFEDYQFPLHTIAESSVADIQYHYEQFAERMDAAILPPGKLLNQVGHFLLQQEEKLTEAIAIFELNTQYYPESFITFQSLAEAYHANAENDLALQAYKEALKCNPGSEGIRRAIRSLEEI
ncbi:alpha/beta hydrolase-fold protein [Catalinimonas sp. 4WD22]|uniref:alpha/beta hydrolase-fold protein n=1 Tax=Catalinimonas locisalis TaxID=3133978 RepID=UPI003100DF9B